MSGRTPGKRADASPLHARNRHRGGLEFPRLVAACPALGPFVAINAWGNESIDFSDPAAVKALNKAMLAADYGVRDWDLPPGYLCPSIPGRADYVHVLADLLASGNGGVIPRGPAVRALDLGTGASWVYPLIGHFEYGWRFVASDIDPAALASAARILEANPGQRAAIELRLQPAPANLLQGVVRSGEVFDVSMCNPPFHSSPAEAEESARRKWRKLGRQDRTPDRKPHRERAARGGQRPTLNFGGQGAELWCPGGEAHFVRRLIAESAREPSRCCWSSTLVSKKDNLPGIERALTAAGVQDRRILELKQGQKTSRAVAWTFLGKRAQQEWAARWR